MKNREQKHRTLESAREILHPENAEFAQTASLAAGLRVIRARRRQRRALRWGMIAAAAALLLGGAFAVFLQTGSETPVAEKGAAPQGVQIPVVSSRSLADGILVRTGPAGVVIPTTATRENHPAIVRTGDRERTWQRMTDEELLTVYEDRPVALIALSDGRKELILFEE